MPAKTFVQRRKLVGLRPLAFAVVALVGTALALLVPAAVAAGLARLAIALGVSSAGVGLTAVVSVLAAWIGVTYLVGRGLEEAVRLRAPWGRIAVGAEGIRWDGWLRRRLTRWRDVQGTTLEGDAIVVITRGGARIALASGEARALETAIRSGLSAHARTARAEVPSALTSEGDTQRWIARARTLLARDSYREGGVPPAALARVLEDADAPPAARVGAAAALVSADRSERTRVESVRDESVDEELALALDDVLEQRFAPARWARLARRS